MNVLAVEYARNKDSLVSVEWGKFLKKYGKKFSNGVISENSFEDFYHAEDGTFSVLVNNEFVEIEKDDEKRRRWD